MILNLKPGRPPGAGSSRSRTRVVFCIHTVEQRTMSESNTDKEPHITLSWELTFNPPAKCEELPALQNGLWSD